MHKKILIEGWRDIFHSYAVVNLFQTIALSKLEGYEVRFSDVPYFVSQWKPLDRNIFGAYPFPNLTPPDDGFKPDITYRISFPYNLERGNNRSHIFVFGTSETGCINANMIKGDLKNLERDDITLITPSRWSKGGFLNSGVDDKRVHIIPHGIEPAIYYPDEERRQSARARFNIQPTDFVFLNNSNMFPNKGMDKLLLSFAEVIKDHPNAKLFLKGANSLYQSNNRLSNTAHGIDPQITEAIKNHLLYIGEDLSFEDMGDIYRAADAFVCPYLCEGFNIPALEALASGIPLICSRGGPTDDFNDPILSLPINTQLGKTEDGQFALVVDQLHITQLMLQVIEQQDYFKSESKSASERIHRHYSWQQVCQQMIKVFNN